VISALVFTTGRLAWLRANWRERRSISLVSRATMAELQWVLGYRKLKLSDEYQIELMSDYLTFCETVEVEEFCSVQCRDKKDQSFLDLAQSGKADVLVTGDRDLLVLVGKTAFLIETPENYRRRVCGDEKQ
jgi:putative PIN family toxin of toxin-antitoxin system